MVATIPTARLHLARGGTGWPSWYVMPEARTLGAALGADPAPRTVVAAVADIATTLAALAEKGVGHRDIKPDNLFERDGRWLVGDFGLPGWR